MMFRLLATGSRDYSDWRTAGRVFGEELTQLPAGTTFIVVHGDCPPRPNGTPGLDQIADRWARSPTIAALYPDYTIIPEPHPADWDRFGRAAGPLRNQEMVDLGADKCVGFPIGKSSGTRDCMRRATAARIPVRVVEVTASNQRAMM